MLIPPSTASGSVSVALGSLPVAGRITTRRTHRPLEYLQAADVQPEDGDEAADPCSRNWSITRVMMLPTIYILADNSSLGLTHSDWHPSESTTPPVDRPGQPVARGGYARNK